MISQSPIEQLQTKLNVSFKCPNTITYFIKFGIEGMMCAVKITDATRLFSLEEHPYSHLDKNYRLPCDKSTTIGSGKLN